MRYLGRISYGIYIIHNFAKPLVDGAQAFAQVSQVADVVLRFRVELHPDLHRHHPWAGLAVVAPV